MTSVTSSTAFTPPWKTVTASEYAHITRDRYADAERLTLDSGAQVAVSGHAYDNTGNMMRLDGDAAQSLMSMVSKLRAGSSQDFVANQSMMQNASAEPLATMTLPEDGFYRVEPDAFGEQPIHSMAHWRFVDLAEAPDLGGGLRSLTTSDQTAMDRMEQMLSAEKELKEIYGDDIKVAYDSVADEMVMLTPDDPAYDKVKTGKQALDDLRLDLFNGNSQLDRTWAKEFLKQFW
ncbi:hypothetical protein T8K17_12465 [Thalassobaculum sp. OXR-137]|uniref:hypothetical protein n=1 Tax=Thalassobaculum sp. OXR-137 TaxID=3100173 RepID=UPI002AC8BB50|nr:hypothetical protein [Thalassobaculum sp. OXR-137]WPZ36941.1 hypothetical protein T8K17_12465 [Thalassobaculum sp. OXR-137]